MRVLAHRIHSVATELIPSDRLQLVQSIPEGGILSRVLHIYTNFYSQLFAQNLLSTAPMYFGHRIWPHAGSYKLYRRGSSE